MSVVGSCYKLPWIEARDRCFLNHSIEPLQLISMPHISQLWCFKVSKTWCLKQWEICSELSCAFTQTFIDISSQLYFFSPPLPFDSAASFLLRFPHPVLENNLYSPLLNATKEPTDNEVKQQRSHHDISSGIFPLSEQLALYGHAESSPDHYSLLRITDVAQNKSRSSCCIVSASQKCQRRNRHRVSTSLQCGVNDGGKVWAVVDWKCVQLVGSCK